MKEITIYGASDDLVEIDGGIREEFYCKNDFTTLLLESPDATAIVTVAYTKQGTWAVGLAPGDEGIGIPDHWGFLIEMSPEVDYSTQLRITNPPAELTIKDISNE
jgi:hypothetical protein